MRRFAILALAAAALAVPVASARPASAAAPQDEMWLKSSIQGDIFEVTGGKLAEQKGQNAAVRALGKRLVADHSKSLADSRKLAMSLGIKPPTSAAPSMQWELMMVRSLPASSFDLWYSRLEVMDHLQDISEAQDEVKMGATQSVRAEAAKAIPTLKTHLKLAQGALKQSASRMALKH